MSNSGVLDRRVGMQLAIVPLVLAVVANLIAARECSGARRRRDQAIDTTKQELDIVSR
jgi:hypothetical protein